MFERLGHFVSRNWAVLLTGWIVSLALLWWVAPKWDTVLYDGEFHYLPDRFPSRQAETLFTKAFSNNLLGSNIVLVARRDHAGDGLLDEDKTYIDETLAPRLSKALGLASEKGASDAAEPSSTPDAAAKESHVPPDKAVAKSTKPGQAPDSAATAEPVVTSIRTFSDKEFGQLLISEDQKATLVILELTTDFTERKNEPAIAAIEELIGKPGQVGQLQQEKGYPTGLDLSLSGSATVGRDMRDAARKSAHATEAATVVLVIVLLFAIYRAPILAVIPLLTVFISVKIAILVLSLMAQADWVRLFSGIEVYVTVVLYGAGVDYCMFLMSRYKEELDNGATFDEAITISVSRVGHALAASAGTVMCGIGMMYFTQFAKFQQAGIAMSFSLIFVLAASLTLTPALLRLAGRWTFWPRVQTERLSTVQGWISPTSMISRLMEREWFGEFWDKVGKALLKRPGTIWIVSFLLMTPFAVVAYLSQNKLSYGLLSELPKNDSSVVGSAAVESHFPAGIIGPVTILVDNPDADFRTDADSDGKRPGWEQIRTFVDSLYSHRDELGIVDIRSIAYPLGMSDRVKMDLFQRRLLLKRAQSHYVSDKPGWGGQVSRIDIVMKDDPFSPGSMTAFDHLKGAAPGFLNGDRANQDDAAAAHDPAPKLDIDKTELLYLGATPSIRDLKSITGEDQVRMDFLVPAVVFLILVVLLRQIATSAYLIFTVFFSYFVTLGVTFVVFYCIHWHGFAGLDWKVPMFLFTILVAVGEDYNILLMARIEEEQQTHGPVEGVIVGLRKTGSIISSCGIIMAGTFSALMAGSLEGLAQLGFALAFGVLLDTFVVRPIVVPAYLILLHQGWFGALGRYLGAEPGVSAQRPRAVAIKD
jgi:putative drug exporter of the RND superfamily